ncbi:HNH endonuclease signature motif containing protein [Paracoccus sp. 22332]|uniref:HNH endonuclease signature motif containing protein n=1 Tax=Paracoccus sp. 22332 TaxID=3453913 RepID=UPI003F84A107
MMKPPARQGTAVSKHTDDWSIVMPKRQLLSPDDLRQLLNYDPETGQMTWKKRPSASKTWNSRYAGKPALTAKQGNGYLHGSVLGNYLLAHRVAWALHYGQHADGEIDHLSGDRFDNRITNLRAVPRATNMTNRIRGAKNFPLPRGVVRTKAKAPRYEARISVSGKVLCLGTFRCPNAAHDAYRAKAIELGYSLRHITD